MHLISPPSVRDAFC